MSLNIFQIQDASRLRSAEREIAAVDFGKANASTVGGIATALNSKASQSSVDALAAGLSEKADASSIPLPANAMPPAVADSGASGSMVRYAREDHTHASKARKRRLGVSASTYTWIYPTPFAAGVVPICNGIGETAAGVTDLINVQLDGPPTNTQCKFRITRISPGLLSLLLGALSINPTPLLHMTAFEP